jgi:hypothetical protein
MRTGSPARAVGLAAWGAGAPACVPNVADPGWGKVMAAAVRLSVVATTGVGIVLTARIMSGIAS